MKEIPLVPMVIFLSGLTLLPLTVLVVYHYKLSMFNQTTYEQRKDTFTFTRRPPFESTSLLKNMWLHIFAPRPQEPIFKPREVFDLDKNQFQIPAMKTPPCPTDHSQSNIYSYQSFSQVSGSNNLGKDQKIDKNVKSSLIGPGKPCESIGSVSDHEININGGSR